MAREASKVLTDRESQIMDVLWRLKTATADQVRNELPDNPHDSSVRTLLRVLIDKGYVRLLKNKKPKEYKAAVSQSAAQKKATRSLLQRFFDGSAETLVMRLLEDEELSLTQLEQMRKTLAKSRKGKKHE